MKWIIIIAVLVLYSCSHSPTGANVAGIHDPESIAKLLVTDEDGDQVFRTKICSVDSAKFTVQLRPLAHVIATSEGIAPTDENIQRFIHQYEGYYYFTLNIERTDVRGDLLKALADDEESYNELIQYVSFNIQNDLSLITDKGDKLSCTVSLFERTYGMKNGLQFSLAFQRPTYNPESITFSLNDKVLGNGPIKVIFNKEELQEPEIQ